MTRAIALAPLALALFAGCGDKDDDTPLDDGSGDEGTGGDEGSGDDGGGGDWTTPEAGVIALSTEDGVTLAADYYPAAAQDAPGVVLLHMVPPSWDRTSWPEDFISRLTDDGYSVIAVDRRGAGDSEGTAKDAYEGPKGKYDVAACVDRLEADGYTGDLVLMGASNGTTSVLDYSVWAAAEGHTVPSAVAFLTGGTYTVANNDMEDLPATTALFTYSTAEKAWSERQMDLDPGSWTFSEYADGDHGTLMFAAEDGFTEDLAGWLAGAL